MKIKDNRVVRSAPSRFPRKTAIPAIFVGLLLFGISTAFSSADNIGSNPIGAVARLFNPKLVKVEKRVKFLDHQLATLAPHEEHHLKTGLGCRGAKEDVNDPDPYVVLDLGKEFPIDEIYLIPIQGELSGSDNIFPKRFTLDFSNTEEFSGKRILYKTGDQYFPETGGKPVRFSGKGSRARYIRLTVNQGELRGKSEVFALSEIVVISEKFPVSLACKVSSSGTVDMGNIWYPQALTDGRMPLGVWEGGTLAPPDSQGEMIAVDNIGRKVYWDLSLAEPSEIDLLILYPYAFSEAMESGVLPEALKIQVRNGGDEEFRTIQTWKAAMRGTNDEVPLVLDCGGVMAEEVRVVGTRAHEIDKEFFYGLSEIEIWSQQKNISSGLTVEASLGDKNVGRTATLTDGFTSERQIISIGTWLHQLHERWRIERELQTLQPMKDEMSARSELNAKWGSVMMLGLTFLIPIFIVERRRLISRSQIDQLRKRIASDLHDEIGSNLGSISLIARTARKDLSGSAGQNEVAEDLGEMESIARESSLAMRDIVWLLERKQDSIGDLIARMRETAARMFREIDYSIECEASKTTSKLSLDAKRHLFLFYKEAVYNILKHSGATSVVIRLYDDGDKLALEVSDNGKGLRMTETGGRQTVQRVRKLDERAELLGGSLSLIPSKDAGIKVLLTVKRSLLIAESTTQ